MQVSGSTHVPLESFSLSKVEAAIHERLPQGWQDLSSSNQDRTLAWQEKH